MEELNEKVDVITYYDSEKKSFLPLRLRWKNRVYKLQKVSHPYILAEKGDDVWIFNMQSITTQFILHFNPKKLSWFLKEIHDIS